MATNLSNKEKQQLRAERAAAALKEKQRRERRRQILTVIGVVVAIALIVAGGFIVNSMRDDTTSTTASSKIPPPGSSYGLTIGSDTAPHSVVIYEDFLCPYCGELEKVTHEKLAQLAEDGKVQVEYRPIVLLSGAGPYSARAALIFTLVQQKYGDDVAKQFHDLLFANQPSEEGPFPSREDLYALAAQAGANADELRTAVDNGEGINEVADATNAAIGLKVKSTPTLVLDGHRFTDGRTIDDLAANLLEALQ